MIRDNIIGNIFKTRYGKKFKVINKVNNSKKFLCEFIDTGFKTEADRRAINKGSIRDYMTPEIYNIGIIGEKPKKDSMYRLLYKIWFKMMSRCYSYKQQEYYKQFTVDKEWLTFKNFKETIQFIPGFKNMLEHNKDIKFSLDKDYIIPNNKIYSKKSCCFIPQDINTFIQNTTKNRNYNFEGVYIRKDNLKFRSSIRENKITKHISCQSNNPIELHSLYWKEKMKISISYLNNEFFFLDNDVKEIIFNRIKHKEKESLKELNRAILDGYFDKKIKELKENV